MTPFGEFMRHKYPWDIINGSPTVIYKGRKWMQARHNQTGEEAWYSLTGDKVIRPARFRRLTSLERTWLDELVVLADPLVVVLTYIGPLLLFLPWVVLRLLSLVIAAAVVCVLNFLSLDPVRAIGITVTCFALLHGVGGIASRDLAKQQEQVYQQHYPPPIPLKPTRPLRPPRRYLKLVSVCPCPAHEEAEHSRNRPLMGKVRNRS